MMKIKMRKRLSAPGLLEAVRVRFNRIPDELKGKTSFPLTDCLMSGLAIFGLKYPSLLQFDQSQDEPKIRHNLQTLYGVDKAPSDTYLRERLDTVEAERLRHSFKACFSALQRGKQLPGYHYFDDAVIISNDGTGFFYSDTIHCENCCQKNHRDGSISYYHQMMCSVMVHPDQSAVIPLWLEPILKQDGSTKNDCERNASKRLLTTLRKMHPKLKMIAVEDALHSNAPHIELLKSLDYQFIIGVKPKDHRWLFEWVNAGGCQTRVYQRKGYRYAFRWMNQVPLNASREDVQVNFLECVETSPKGKQQTFTWVTDIPITDDNVYRVMRAARARWKIENEAFNTLTWTSQNQKVTL